MIAQSRPALSSAVLAVVIVIIVGSAVAAVLVMGAGPIWASTSSQSSQSSNPVTTTGAPSSTGTSTTSTTNQSSQNTQSSGHETTTGSSTPTATLTSTSTSTIASAVTESSSHVNSSLGLRLDLNVTVTGSGYVTVQGDDFNALNSTSNIRASNDWPMPPGTVNPYDECPVGFPVGIAILNGSYSEDNFTSGNALALYNTNNIASCTESAPVGMTSYSFRPLSTYATELVGNQTSYGASTTISSSSFGYWTGSADLGPTPAFHTFSSNITYTALAVDEWGDVVLLHFVPQPLRPPRASRVHDAPTTARVRCM